MPQQTFDRPRLWKSYWVPGVLLAFAAVLIFNPLPFNSPVIDAPQVPPWVTDTTPVRSPKLEPEYHVAVFTYRCNDCHAIIPPPPQDRYRTVTQHKEIDLQHGLNASCLNCHHPTNRDTFVDDRGGEIPWNQPQRLCAKCHGPVFRDWQNGAHGRTNGYWNTSLGTQTRRKCIECHDPHKPPFTAMQPAPAPRTLRMVPRVHAEHPESHRPLRLSGHAADPNTQNAAKPPP